MPDRKIEVTSKYPALSRISVFYRFVAWWVLLIAVVMAASNPRDLGYVVISISIGVIGSTFLCALSETIKVFLDIEANTRRAYEQGNN